MRVVVVGGGVVGLASAYRLANAGCDLTASWAVAPGAGFVDGQTEGVAVIGRQTIEAVDVDAAGELASVAAHTAWLLKGEN